MVAASAFSLAMWAGPGASQEFPADLDLRPLRVWLSAETSIAPTEVVAVSLNDILAVTKVEALEGARALRVGFRAEVVNAALAQSEGYRSWSGRVDVDCEAGKVRLLAIERFAGRNLQGARTAEPFTGDWVAPPPGSGLDALAGAICNPSFERPYGGAPTPVQPVVAPPVEPARPAYLPMVAQVAAADSSAAAAGELARLRGRLGPEAPPLERVETVVVRGRTYYRAQFHGFETTEAAEALCARLKASRHECLIRPLSAAAP